MSHARALLIAATIVGGSSPNSPSAPRDGSAPDRARNQIIGVVGHGIDQIDDAGGFTTFNAAWRRPFRRTCAERSGNCRIRLSSPASHRTPHR